jgi:hypothetical protein
MRNYTSILMMIFWIVLSQCKKVEETEERGQDILSYTWGTNDRIFIEDYKFHSHKFLDTLENQLEGDSLVPIRFLDQKRMIVTQLVPTSMKMTERGGMTEYVITQAQFLPDTFIFASKKYIDKQFLLLFSNTSATRVFELKSSETTVPEIRSDYQPEFQIHGYSVGDEIERNQLDVIYSDIFGSRVTEEAFLVGNEDIKFTLLGYRYIEKIEKSNIPDEELNQLIRAIDKIFKRDHEYEEIENGTNEFKEIVKGYYWNERDVSIFLQKTERPWENQEENFWTLEYSNYVITTILQNYLEETPENL